MKRTSFTLVLTIVLLSFLNFLSAQIKEHTSTSTDLHASVTQSIGETEITISYYRMAAEGSESSDVPILFNQILIGDSGCAITFTCSKNVLIENEVLNAGSYSVFVIANEGKWTMIFTQAKDVTGEMLEDNAAVISVNPEKYIQHEEWLTIGFSNFKNSTADVILRWGRFSISFTTMTGDILKALVEKSARDQHTKIFPELLLLYRDAEINPESEITLNTTKNVTEDISTEVVNVKDETVTIINNAPWKELPSIDKVPLPICTPSPVYPEFQRRANIEGHVKVKMLITNEGKVGKAEISNSNDIGFDEPALHAVNQWTFVPAIQNNIAVSMWVETEFYFKAKSE